MKVDLEKEMFLQRVDLRITHLGCILGYHEKILLNVIAKTPKQAKEFQDMIDKHHKGIFDICKESDSKIQDFYKEVEKKLMENENNENL